MRSPNSRDSSSSTGSRNAISGPRPELPTNPMRKGAPGGAAENAACSRPSGTVTGRTIVRGLNRR